MTPRDLLTLLALAGLWGSSFLFIRLGVDALPPLAVVELRLALGALAVGTIAAAARVTGLRRALRRPVVAVTGLCAMGIPFVLYAYAETRVASGVAGISNATTPLFAALLAQALPLRAGGERLTAGRAAGLLVGFGGVCLLASDGLRGDLDPVGLALCVGAPLLYAAGGVLARDAYRGVDPVVSAVAGTTLSTLIILPAALVWGRPDHLPGIGALAAVAVLGVFGTGIAFVLFYRLMARLGSATFTVTYLMPVVAVVEGALFLAEPVRPTSFGALAAILLGVAVANGFVRWPRRQPLAVEGAAPSRAA